MSFYTKGIHTIIFVIISETYLKLYEKLYNHRNNMIVQLYEYLYLGMLTIIRVITLIRVLMLLIQRCTYKYMSIYNYMSFK